LFVLEMFFPSGQLVFTITMTNLDGISKTVSHALYVKDAAKDLCKIQHLKEAYHAENNTKSVGALVGVI